MPYGYYRATFSFVRASMLHRCLDVDHFKRNNCSLTRDNNCLITPILSSKILIIARSIFALSRDRAACTKRSIASKHRNKLLNAHQRLSISIPRRNEKIIDQRYKRWSTKYGVVVTNYLSSFNLLDRVFTIIGTRKNTITIKDQTLRYPLKKPANENVQTKGNKKYKRKGISHLQYDENKPILNAIRKHRLVTIAWLQVSSS